MKAAFIAVLVVIISGCASTAPKGEATSPRWQVVPIGNDNAVILLDTHTGETWSSWSTPTEWRPMKR